MIFSILTLVLFVVVYTSMATRRINLPWARSFGIWALALTGLKCGLVWTAYFLDLKYDPMGSALKSFSVPILAPEIFIVPMVFNLRQMTNLSWSLALTGFAPIGAGLIAGTIALARHYSRNKH